MHQAETCTEWKRASSGNVHRVVIQVGQTRLAFPLVRILVRKKVEDSENRKQSQTETNITNDLNMGLHNNSQGHLSFITPIKTVPLSPALFSAVYRTPPILQFPSLLQVHQLLGQGS